MKKEDGEDEDEDEENDVYYDYENTIEHSDMQISEVQWRAKGSHASYPALMFYSRVLKCVQKRRMIQGCSPLKEVSFRLPKRKPREDSKHKSWEPEELQGKFEHMLKGMIEKVEVVRKC